MIQPLRWPAEALWEAVSPLLPGFTVEVLPSIDSTNTELMRRARTGLGEPTLLVAQTQTAGRGRLGRTWHSDGGSTQELPSLTFSLGLPLAPQDWSGLSLAVGVSVAESLQPALPVAGEGGLAGAARVGLKWPNDLWLSSVHGDRKLGGILVETASVVRPREATDVAMPVVSMDAASPRATRYVVVGVGINVLPRDAQGLSLAPGSLQEVEPGLTAPEALRRIVPPLVQMLLMFAEQGFGPVQPRFATRDVLAGRAVTLSDGRAGVAQGVADDGALRVHTAAGMVHVTSSEISVRPTVVPSV